MDGIVDILESHHHVVDLLSNVESHLYAEIFHKALFVNKDQKVDDIFKAFNKEKKHIAIVLEDEKVIGMITMEDVLEELVGEINEKRVNLIKGASRK